MVCTGEFHVARLAQLVAISHTIFEAQVPKLVWEMACEILLSQFKPAQVLNRTFSPESSELDSHVIYCGDPEGTMKKILKREKNSIV